jgi:predicted AAA+ superfamily ATPase
MCPSQVAYRPRIADQELRDALGAAGAVLIEGPRACGKTATARHAAASEVALDTDIAARRAGLLDASVLLEGTRPRLVDEWQLVPEIWNQVRRAIDDSGGRPGAFILTGSAVPPEDRARHTGAGRILRLRLRPMTLRESGHSTGDVSLGRLLAGEPARAPDPGLTIRDLARLVSVGGWPALQDGSTERALALVRGYVSDTAHLDLPHLDGIRREPQRVTRVMESLARYTASTASARAIAADVGAVDAPMKAHTVLDYLDALTRVFVLEDLPQWGPRLRSKARLRGAAKRHFVDPSIAVAALGAGPERLLREVDTLALLFESLVIRDLRTYAQAQDAVVRHYQDSTGLEADAIVETRDGRWGAFEVKLGSAAIDDAAASLLRLAARVDQDRHGPPAVLGVITGWGYGYRRPDGVDVIPIGALAP